MNLFRNFEFLCDNNQIKDIIHKKLYFSYFFKKGKYNSGDQILRGLAPVDFSSKTLKINFRRIFGHGIIHNY